MEQSSNNCIANDALYYELCEVKKFWNVTRNYKGDISYCTAKISENGSSSIFIPVPCNVKIGFLEIDNFLALFNIDSVYLAIQAPDSSVVFYQVSRGLQELNFQSEPSRKNRFDKSIYKSGKYLLSLAQSKDKCRTTT